jgi:hypothetical protein
VVVPAQTSADLNVVEAVDGVVEESGLSRACHARYIITFRSEFMWICLRGRTIRQGTKERGGAGVPDPVSRLHYADGKYHFGI